MKFKHHPHLSPVMSCQAIHFKAVFILRDAEAHDSLQERSLLTGVDKETQAMFRKRSYQ